MRKVTPLLLFLLFANVVVGQFSGDQDITYSAYAEKVFSADIDGDGNMDVLSASSRDNKISWYKNLGGGNFDRAIVISSNAMGAFSVYAADLDNDGDLDVLSASEDDNKIAWYENLGGGVFGNEKIISLLASGARDVKAADIDGDGDLDVVSANMGSTVGISWYENLGGGNFGPRQTITTLANGANTVLCIDFDADGDIDVLSSSTYDGKLALYENLGGGSFATQQVLAVRNNAKSIAVGDLDGDGDLDIVGAGDGFVHLYENLGNGSFTFRISIPQPKVNCVYLEDIDSDGDLDVFVANSENDKIAYYENLGNWSLAAEVIIHFRQGASNYATSVYVADIDNDGLKDVLSSSSNNSYNVSWYKNLGLGNFGVRKYISSPPLRVRQNYLSITDLDNDGDVDILFSGQLIGGSFIGWYESQGGGSYGTHKMIDDTTNSLYAVCASDVDNDGDMDVLAASYTGYEIFLYKNLGSGTFGQRQMISSAAYPIAIVPSDVDSDGDQDLIISQLDVGGLLYDRTVIITNLGGGNYSNIVVIANSSFNSIHVVDIDNDGDEDIIGASGNTMSLGINNGAGSYVWQPINNSYGVRSIYTFDIDNDGLKDIVTSAKESNNTVRIAWYKNLGGNTFTRSSIATNVPDSRHAYAGDIDGDGDIDVFSAGGDYPSPGEVSWHENQGGGNFIGNSKKHTFLSQIEYSTTFVNLVDIDNDGDLDVLSNPYELTVNENYFYFPKLKGKLFFDANQNAVLDTNELGFNNFKVKLQPHGLYSYSNINGNYEFAVDTGTYTVTYQSNPLWSLTTDSNSYTRSLSISNQAYDSLNFGFYPDSIVTLLNPELTGGMPRCNEVINYWININNIGTNTPSGIAHLQLDDSIGYVGSTIIPDSIIGQNIYWHYDSINYFDDTLFALTVFMPPFTSMGDTLTSYLTVYELDGIGNVIYSNIDTLNQILVCAYDPNDKSIDPIGISTQGYVLNDTKMEYLVRFQNTGNDTAKNVMIRDQLDTDLDWSTMYPVASSHPMQVWIEQDGEAIFNFENIMLPDSGADFIGSQGFVKFVIDMKPNLIQGTTLLNEAHIYFDFNPAVITNRTLNTIYDCNYTPFEVNHSTTCYGETLTAYSSEGMLNNYLWEIDTLFSSTNDSLIWFADTIGTFNLKLRVTNELCSNDTSINITILPTIPLTNINTTICSNDSIFLQGAYQSSAGTYYDSLQTINGCDSVLSTTLFINPVYLSNTNDTICQGDSIFLYGEYRSLAGVYYDSLQTINGCDSVLSTVLVVNSSYLFTQNQSICQGDSVLVYGNYQSVAGVYYDSLQSINGCDSVLSITLSVNPVYLSNTNDTICQGDSLLIYGNYENTAGVYYDTLQTIFGCDSVLATALFLNANFNFNQNQEICQGDSILIYGTYQNTSGTYYDSLQTINGCDSVLSTTLTINSSYLFPQNQSICQGDSVLIYGNYQSVAGTYYDSLQTINGCDSVLSITLSVNPVYLSNTNDTICQGDSVLIYGKYENTAGVYYDTLQTIFGCDSVLTTTLFLNANFNSSQNQDICQGDSILIYGTYQNTSGVYYDSLQTINGCDSVLSTTLTVNTLPNVTLTNFNPDTICSSNSAVALPNGSPSGGVYSGAGVSGGTFDPNTAGIGTHSVIYTYSDANSCINSDSTFITVEQCVGIDDLANDLGILIYPNPNTGLFTIEKSSELDKEVNISLLDASSRVIINKIIPKGQQKIEVDITSYSKGIYYLQMTIGDKVYVKQILKN